MPTSIAPSSIGRRPMYIREAGGPAGSGMSCVSCGRRCCMRELPTGTVTLLFTDIEGSTRLLQQVGHRYDGIVTDCPHLLRAAFHRCNGYEVDTQGDAFFVAFARATDAVSAAVEMQRALAAHPWPDGATVHVRMGLHTGEPQRSAEGYVGLDVHRAARIMSARSEERRVGKEGRSRGWRSS